VRLGRRIDAGSRGHSRIPVIPSLTRRRCRPTRTPRLRVVSLFILLLPLLAFDYLRDLFVLFRQPCRPKASSRCRRSSWCCARSGPVPPPGVRGPLPVLRRCHQEFEVLRGHCFVTRASANLPQAVIKLASHPFDL
jgi:hypothetical protein